MIVRLRKLVNGYLNSDKQFPTVIAIASGLYPMLYCYSRNFSLVNSVDHLLFFIITFIAVPVVVFNFVHLILKKAKLERYSIYVLALLNVFIFLFLIKTITYF